MKAPPPLCSATARHAAAQPRRVLEPAVHLHLDCVLQPSKSAKCRWQAPCSRALPRHLLWAGPLHASRWSRRHRSRHLNRSHAQRRFCRGGPGSPLRPPPPPLWRHCRRRRERRCRQRLLRSCRISPAVALRAHSRETLSWCIMWAPWLAATRCLTRLVAARCACCRSCPEEDHEL